MSWLFSRALVEEYSAVSCSDGGQSAQLSGVSTPLAYCAPDKMKGFSRLSRFGVTFKLLTDELGADVLTLYLEAFPVKTSALPEKAQVSTVNDLECGATWLGSLGKYDPASRSWKTAQRSFLGDLEESLVTWPRSGMTAAGECWELPMLEPITSGTGSGLWLPTPCATDAGSGRMNTSSGSSNQRPMLALMARKSLWPTPTTRDRGTDAPTRTGGPSLGVAVRWPTPTTQDNVQVRGMGAAANAPSRGTTLGGAVRMWPTPTAHNAKETNAPSEHNRNTPTLAAQAGGQLSPMWVEWLMGWPLGWTDLKPSVTDKCLCARPQHGECLEGQ